MDYKLIVAIYAAIVSTIVFIWRLYEFYADRKSKFNIKINRVTKIPVSANYKLAESQTFLTTTIVNVGTPKRHIEQPIFKANKKVDGQKYFNFLSFDNVIKYPITLDSGEKFVYDVSDDVSVDLKTKGILKIKAIIKDTHGKNYESKWFKI
ncbi:hypothetical protein [Allomuricauda sp. d1]|uniref:hypothetical protein n=1 Tax=Allomuricauda sp. d1 TaxID=3136725 RepID=UPI0031DEE632